MFVLGLLATSVFLYAESTHIFGLDKDFNKLSSDKELSNHVQEVLKRLKTFKVSVHPRIRFFYQLLKKGMSDYSHRIADSLYIPNVYQKENK
ncbi:unnamed protein product, partial [Brenthis ino]